MGSPSTHRLGALRSCGLRSRDHRPPWGCSHLLPPCRRPRSPQRRTTTALHLVRVRVRVLGSGAEVGVRAVGQGQGCRSGSLRVTQGHRSSLHERACRCRLLRTDACADTCRPSVWESRCVAAELSLRRCPPKQNAREPAQTNTSLS